MLMELMGQLCRYLVVILSEAKSLPCCVHLLHGSSSFASLRMTWVSMACVFRKTVAGVSGVCVILALLAGLSHGYAADETGADGGPVPLVVRADIDRSVITIGDKVRYTLTVTADPSVEFDMPPFGEEVAGFAILDHGIEEERDRAGRCVATQWYLLDTYTVDTYVIVPAAVTYRDESGEEKRVSAPPVSVRVESLLDRPGAEDELRDIKPPVSVPRPRAGYYIATGAVGVLALGGLALWIVRRRRGRVAEPPLPPWQTAYAQLAHLRDMDLPAKGEIDRYYVHLSDIVRHYIENRFGLHAPDMTTEEFLAVVAGGAGLPQRHESLLTTFLSHCDMVKFAKYGPTEEETLDAFDTAVRFVDETAYGLAPETEPQEVAA